MSKKIYTMICGCIVGAQTIADACIVAFVEPSMADKIVSVIGVACTAIVTAMGYFVKE